MSRKATCGGWRWRAGWSSWGAPTAGAPTEPSNSQAPVQRGERQRARPPRGAQAGARGAQGLLQGHEGSE